jgi:hypothetical protein
VPTKPPPSSGPLIDWLRDEARAPFEAPRGDVGDQVALQWLPELAEADSRVGFAVGKLLGEGDPVVTERLLHVATNAAMRCGVATALADAAPTLATLDAGPTSSMLGRAVRTLQLLRGVGALPVPALQTLHGIDQREDGWPTSVAIGLASATSRFLDLVVPALTRASAADTHELAWVFLANASEETIATVLKHVGKHASSTLRDNLANALARESP